RVFRATSIPLLFVAPTFCQVLPTPRLGGSERSIRILSVLVLYTSTERSIRLRNRPRSTPRLAVFDNSQPTFVFPMLVLKIYAGALVFSKPMFCTTRKDWVP